MTVHLLGFPTTLGLPRSARRHAPEAMRAGGLVDMLNRLGLALRDSGDLPLENGLREDPVPVRVQKVVDAARRQAEHWQSVHKPGDLMVTLGGDHSTSLGTIWALAAAGEPFDIVWIDAHGDFNVLETSPSGNPHGMVLALACGLLPEYMPQLVPASNLRLWGIRDLDPGERRLLTAEGVDVRTPDQVRQDWHRLLPTLKPNVFLSFDIDSVDPSEAPGTMTPVPGGLRRPEALELVWQVARNRNLLALDIVEFHPDMDRGNVTLDLALAVARTALSGVLERTGGQQTDATAGN